MALTPKQAAARANIQGHLAEAVRLEKILDEWLGVVYDGTSRPHTYKLCEDLTPEVLALLVERYKGWILRYAKFKSGCLDQRFYARLCFTRDKSFLE